MSISSIFSSSFANIPLLTPSTVQQFKQDVQQPGQDLHAGNLTGAQTDFANLQQLESSKSSGSTAQSSNPIAQAFKQLAQDLQSGNLSAAQQDFNTLQQDIQNSSQSQQVHHHHHHHSGGSNGNNGIAQLFSQLGKISSRGIFRERNRRTPRCSKTLDNLPRKIPLLAHRLRQAQARGFRLQRSGSEAFAAAMLRVRLIGFSRWLVAIEVETSATLDSVVFPTRFQQQLVITGVVVLGRRKSQVVLVA